MNRECWLDSSKSKNRTTHMNFFEGKPFQKHPYETISNHFVLRLSPKKPRLLRNRKMVKCVIFVNKCVVLIKFINFFRLV